MTDGEHPNGGRGDVMLAMALEAREHGRLFFYVRIPEDIGPSVRGDRYEEELEAALRKSNLGEVTGGGSQLGEGDSVEYSGIDVVVTDRVAGLALICSTMRELECPLGTIVEEYLPRYVEHRVWPAVT